MIDQMWDTFVIYVNAYYAVQETYDSARRNWERPAEGLEVFCRDANPFLWDDRSSAERELYEGFAQSFNQRFEDGLCAPADGYAFAREWLSTLEGNVYGSALVSAFDATCDLDAFCDACEPVARQLAARAMRLERTPQDEPQYYIEEQPSKPSPKDVEAVIALLSKGDEAFAASLRARLEADGE